MAALDPLRVYTKTIAGQAEIINRRHGLSTGARRILILMDGHRRLADLSRFSRDGDLERVVEELEALGLIAFAGVSENLSDQEVQQRAGTEMRTLGELKNSLRGLFIEQLGPAAGQIFEDRVRDSVSLEIMRRVLREAVEEVRHRRGDLATRRLLSTIDPILNPPESL